MLSLFYQKKRWPASVCARSSSRVTADRCFVGEFREMSRLLRVKADLRQIVMSSEYNTHRCSSDGRTKDELDDGDEFDDHIGSEVKAMQDFLTTFDVNLVRYSATYQTVARNGWQQDLDCKGMFNIGQRIEKLHGRGIL